MTTEAVKTQLDKQNDYVKQDRIKRMQDYVDKRKGGSGGLFDAELAVKSMRSAGYRTEAHAAADIIDNSIESGATQIHLVTNQTNGQTSDIAFIDDGSGILASFLPWAVSWGASAQHGDEGKRNTFGRFGFGLPTASVNRGTKFQVISRTTDDFHMVTVDIVNLPRGTDGLPIQPQIEPGKLPKWVIEYLSDKDTSFRGGLKAAKTVVVWSGLDRLSTRSLPELESLMLRHFGVTYAGWLNQVAIAVNGTAVVPIDVLFTSRNALYFDVKGTRADDHGSQIVPVKTPGGVFEMTVRIAALGADAQTVKLDTGKKGQPPKIREKIRKEYNGFFMTRHGRFIELWKPNDIEGINWNNYMRQVAVHIDFPPELDEVFGITPDKQVIRPMPLVVELLESKGIFRTMRNLVKGVADERSRRKAEREGRVEDGSRVSERVMDRVTQMDVLTSQPQSLDKVTKREEEARKNLEQVVRNKAKKAGVSAEVIRSAVVEETSTKRFRVELASLGANGVFFHSFPIGMQTVLQINVDHAFFKDVYSKIEPGQFELLSGIELLLFTLALCESDSMGEKAAFYSNEKIRWSQYLTTMIHVQNDVISNSDLGNFTGENAIEVQETD
jgi:hypothetical protein